MLHSIFHTVDMSHDDSMAEDMMEDDMAGEEVPDDNAVDVELSPGDFNENSSDGKDILPSTKKFHCEDCSKFFTTNKTLRRHIRRIHNKSPPLTVRSPPLAKIAAGSAVCCRDCGIWFSAKKNLLRHTRTSTTHRQRAEKKRILDGEVVENHANQNIPERSSTDDVTENIDEGRVYNEELDIVEVKVELSSDGPLENMNVDEESIEDIKIDQSEEEMNSEGTDHDMNVVETDRTDEHEAISKPEVSPRKIIDSTILKKYPCEECGQQFTKKSNVYRHMRRIHHMNVAVQKSKSSPIQEYKTLKVFSCEKCDQKYLKKCDMERHVDISHNESDPLVSNSNGIVPNSNSVPSNSPCGKEIICEHCFQHFASRSNLLRHMRRQHLSKITPSNATPKIKLKSVSIGPPVINQPFLVLDKHLRLTDYPFLKNMLPASYDYNLRCYSVLKENTSIFKHKCFDATLQFHCNTLGESKYWVTLFEKANRLSFTLFPSQENDSDSTHHYECSIKGCPSLLIITTTGVTIQRKNVFRVTVRIVHKHNHQWGPPRVDLSQLVEAVIEEQDMVDGESEQISVEPDTSYCTPATMISADSQAPVMTLYFNKSSNSFVAQDVSLLTNGACNVAPPPLMLVSKKLVQDENVGTMREFDAVGQFKRVCADMTVMIQQDPQYFADAVQQLEKSFDRVCSSKDDLLRALYNFGKGDGIPET